MRHTPRAERGRWALLIQTLRQPHQLADYPGREVGLGRKRQSLVVELQGPVNDLARYGLWLQNMRVDPPQPLYGMGRGEKRVVHCYAVQAIPVAVAAWRRRRVQGRYCLERL